MQRDPIVLVLVGHGAPATDCPPQLVGELMGLQWSGNGHHAGAHDSPKGRVTELDQAIRNWPRTVSNDPYKAGLEAVARALRKQLPSCRVILAYNEFCRPSIEEAIEQEIRNGAGRIFVIPSMLTPGGIHSEQDIPRTLDRLRNQNTHTQIIYLWPFEVATVAALLAAQLRQHLKH
ncbi:MAG: CbiX/SirB N-terminal domain-containing protein [Candidatus Omnitrophica bacterium]|nr:CbiX/SirB N-terminal domain-containing protein [Candidatus Omnitrophota bacterium]MBI3009999.1 CbiX/SirB N-terminal domain-containing protein [Candidatus Omnitrophota bacterium]